MSTIIVTISIVLFLIEVNAKETVRLGVLISQEGDEDLSGYIPAMELAVEIINDNESLPFYFIITRNDSKVSYYTV